jgi:hypothetical protein
MRRIISTGLGALVAGLVAFETAPAQAQSVGYVTGFPGRDPAGDDDGIGWGPAYRPETSFAQPGTPPTPGEYAAADYYRRTGRTVYPPVGTFDPAAAPRYEVYERPRRVIRAPLAESRREVRQRAPRKRVVSR